MKNFLGDTKIFVAEKDAVILKKYIYTILLVIILLAASAPLSAKEWYEGGTLHDATIAQWKRAKRQDKIATCADWVSALYMKNKLALLVSGTDYLKTCTTALVDYIDEASKKTKDLDREDVSSVALFGMIIAGWIRQDDISDLLPIINAAKPSSPLESAENAEQKLKANGFLLDEEVETIWDTEKTPNVLEKLSEAQKKAIADEIDKAETESGKSAEEFGSSITDELEKSMYQEAVRKNKILKATRAIAKKYEIQPGDIFTVRESLLPPEVFYEGEHFYEGSSLNENYSPSATRKRNWIWKIFLVGTKWEPDAMAKRFGKYDQYDPADGNPQIMQMFYFKDIDMTFLVNMLSFKVVTWRSGRVDK